MCCFLIRESNRSDWSIIVWQKRSFRRSSRGQPEGSSAPGRWSGSAPGWSPQWLLSRTPDCPGPRSHPRPPARTPWKHKQRKKEWNNKRMIQVRDASWKVKSTIRAERENYQKWLITSGKISKWYKSIKDQIHGLKKVYLSSSFLLLSTENLYWNPEQPPPSTCILRYSPFAIISASLWKEEKNLDLTFSFNASSFSHLKDHSDKLLCIHN